MATLRTSCQRPTTNQHNRQQQQSQQNVVVADDKASVRINITNKYRQIKEKTSLTQRKRITLKVDKSEVNTQPDVPPVQQESKCNSKKFKYTKRSKTRNPIQSSQHRNVSKSFSLSNSKKDILTSINWNCEPFRYLDSNFYIMLTMLFVATVVISGNAALAAQRDSFKIKDTKSIGNSVNAIPTDSLNANAGNNANNGNGSTGSANLGGTNTISNGTAARSNSNFADDDISDVNVPIPVTTTKTTSATINTTVRAATTTSISTSTGSTLKAATSMGSSGSGSNNIASGSLQKASSASANSLNGNVGINRNVIEIMEEARNGPYFDKAASKNVTALLGKTAYLNCRVKNLGNKTMLLQVSWVRHRDIHLLTVGRYTYTSDQRFRAIHQPQTEDWILQIKYPQHRDSGIYECQVSTTPHMSHYIHLNVVEPSTEIIGAPDLYIESGSTINLTCVILNSPEPPAYIFWNHNNAIINYDSPRGGVSVVTNKGETTTSFLLIKSARPSDSGFYQCNPSNAKPKSVTVHVLNGEFPAAMQRAAQVHHRMSQSHYLLVYLFIYLFSLAYVGRFMKLSP